MARPTPIMISRRPLSGDRGLRSNIGRDGANGLNRRTAHTIGGETKRTNRSQPGTSYVASPNLCGKMTKLLSAGAAVAGASLVKPVFPYSALSSLRSPNAAVRFGMIGIGMQGNSLLGT